MNRSIYAAAVACAIVAPARAHFPFLVPDGPNKGKAVFSDNLKPDPQVPVDRLANTKLVLVADGKATDLAWTLDKKTNCYTFEVPGSGSRAVVATTDYGVLQRGDSKPFLLRYRAKAVFGDPGSPEKATPGDKVPLELVPYLDGGKLRFKVWASGKPLAKAEVNVLVPGEAKSKIVTTDEAGLTPTFAASGQYGAHARLVEEKAGEQDGKKYQEVRHYATVVVTFGK